MGDRRARSAILAAVLVFILLLGGLTIKVAIGTGIDILIVISLIVLAMFGFGIVGALRNPPE